MRTVNNKYLIDYEINVEENFREYIVRKYDNNKKYILCILKNDFTYEKTRHYLLSRFKTIKNLNFENVVNILDMEIISDIDGIKLDRPRYGYLLELIKPKPDTLRYLKSCKIKDRLDIFMEFAAAVNTLNMNGYIFNDITLKDIFIVTDKYGRVKVKIKNLLQREINKFSVINVSNNELPYPINIEKGEDSTYARENISEVLDIFDKIFSENDLKELKNIRRIFSEVNTINNFFKIKYFIKYVNEKCKTNYKQFCKEALNAIVNDIDVVGFEEELKFVEKSYISILENKERYKIIEFNGDSGSGKTRLLNEIKYMLEGKYFANVIYFKDYNGKYTNYQLYDLYLKEIYSYFGDSLIEKYGIYFRKLLALITHTDSVINDNTQIMQLINRIGKFIAEYTMTKPLVLLVDNLQKRDKAFLRLLKYLSLWANNIENLIIIFSINENESSEELLKEVNEIKNLDGFKEYRLGFLNQYNTVRMIQNMLKTNNKFPKLINRIFSEALGNPQYIKAVINELYSSGLLYFNTNIGVWECDIDNRKTLIPKELVEKLEGCLFELNIDEISVLQKLSIFEALLSEDIIYKYILTTEKEFKVFRELKIKGYFIDKISDHGILVGFTNNLLRNIIYLKLSDEKRHNMHYNACEFLRRELKEADYYIEEFILHLNKSGQKDKLFRYMRKYAIKLKEKGNFRKSITYFIECLKYCDKKEAIDIDIMIAKQYEKIANYKNSYKYFSIAMDNIKNGSYDLKLKVYVTLEMIIIKTSFIGVNNENVARKLEDVREILYSMDYPLGEAYYYYAVSLNSRITNNRDALVQNAEKALNICENNNICSDIYGWILITLGMVYFKYKEIDKCKVMVKSAIENFTNNNNINGTIISKIVYAQILSEYTDMNDLLRNYFELNKLCVHMKIYAHEILVLNGIADLYLSKNDYNSAEKYLLKVLSIKREEGINSYSLKIYNSLTNLYIKWGKINEAVKYYHLSCHVQEGTRIFEDDFIYKNIVSAEYNDMICNHRAAYEIMEDVFKLIKNSKTNKCRITRCLYYELQLYSCSDEEMIQHTYEKLDEELADLNDNDKAAKIRIDAAKRILDLGYYNFSERIFNSLQKNLEDNNAKGIYSYLELSFKGKEYYNFLINKALTILNYITDKKIKSDILYIIGVKYFELKCYTLAVNYYYESISIDIGIIKSLPYEEKVIYANGSNFMKCRRKIFDCLNNNIKMNFVISEIDFIENNEQLNDILWELDLNNSLKNKKAYSFLQRIYEKIYYNNWSNIYKALESFSSSIEENLKILLKYMARITFANKGVIIREDNEGNNSVISSYRVSKENEISKYLLWKLESEEDITVLENNDDLLNQLNNENITGSIKACIYMKLRNNDRRNRNSTFVNARLILISQNSINYINHESKKIIEKFKPLLIFLLEQYNLTILSTIDKLTDVYNRKYLEESLISLINNSRIERKQFCVIMFDIDDFKGINDKFGHQIGDEVLIKLTKEVKKCINKNDIIGRYGGEEFIVLIPNVDEEEAFNIAENIRISVDEAKILGEKRSVTISVGIAMGNNYLLTSEELIERADEALYKSKDDGKNRCTLWRKNYKISDNKVTNNEFMNLLSRNITKNNNLFSTIKDISDLVKIKETFENRINKFISKIINAMECEMAAVFMVKNDNIRNTFSKERGKEGFTTSEKFNFISINKCISSKRGVYLVDWNNINNNSIYVVHDWKSICIAPVLYNGQVIAVVYVSVSVSNKEFNEIDLSILNCLIDVAIPIFC